MAQPGTLLSIVFQSSHLHSATYDPATHMLQIVFTNGRRYQNHSDSPVPSAVWAELIRTGSPGKFFDTEIKPYWGGVDITAHKGVVTVQDTFDPAKPAAIKSIP